MVKLSNLWKSRSLSRHQSWDDGEGIYQVMRMYEVDVKPLVGCRE